MILEKCPINCQGKIKKYCCQRVTFNMSVVFLMDLLWFNFILGLNFLYFKNHHHSLPYANTKEKKI